MSLRNGSDRPASWRLSGAVGASGMPAPSHSSPAFRLVYCIGVVNPSSEKWRVVSGAWRVKKSCLYSPLATHLPFADVARQPEDGDGPDDDGDLDHGGLVAEDLAERAEQDRRPGGLGRTGRGGRNGRGRGGGGKWGRERP